MIVNERLKQFAAQKGLTAYRMAKDSGLNIVTVTNYLNLKRCIGSENLVVIVKTYPELDLEWLMRGQGEPMKRKEVA